MRSWWPLVAVCAGSLLFLVDTTAVVVASPDIGRDFGATLGILQWVPNGYTLVLAVSMLTVGSLSDRFGPRRTYLAGLAVFGLASLGCAVAGSVGALIAARAVQGLGGAALAVTGFALILATYADRARSTAIGVYFAVNSLGAAIGPMVGGLLTEYGGWRAVFAVNLPVVLATVAVTVRVVRRDPPVHRVRLDPAGAATFAVAATGLTYGLSRGEWGSPVTLASLAAAVLAFAAFVAVERRVARPLLDLTVFRSAAFATLLGCCVASTLVFAALWYASVWLQSGLGLGPVVSGVALMPLAVASFVTSTVAGRLLGGVSPRLLVVAGVLVGGVGCAVQAGLSARSGALAVTAGLAVCGVGVGLAGPAMGAAIGGALPPERGGMAAGILTTVRQLGQTLGVAVLGIAFAAGSAGRPGPGPAAAGLDAVYLTATLVAAVTGATGLVALAALRRRGVASSARQG